MTEGSGAVSFVWGDGEEHAFRLPLKQLRELQTKVEAGPYALAARIRSGEWRVDDLRQTIRLGLIGGGMDPAKSAGLVAAYVDDRPLLESVAPALVILSAALVGPGEDNQEKKAAAETGPIPATGSTSLN